MIDNERADCLAAVSVGVSMDISVIINAVKHINRQKEADVGHSYTWT